jgi:hypothetical protein
MGRQTTYTNDDIQQDSQRSILYPSQLVQLLIRQVGKSRISAHFRGKGNVGDLLVERLSSRRRSHGVFATYDSCRSSDGSGPGHGQRL